MLLADGLNALIRLFLSPTCVGCGSVLEHPLDGAACARCWRQVRRLTPPCCERCGDALPSFAFDERLCVRCRRQQPLVQIARSAGVYDGSLREIIHAFKYERRRALAAPLAHLMRTAGLEVLDQADAVVPVPLSLRRAMDRGFNQADDLARLLGPPVWRILKRTRHGPPQANLPAAHRHANVRGAYALSRLPHVTRDIGIAAPASVIRGRTIVLVDDVMTTGATLDACAEVLLAAGVSSVRALTAARAVSPAPRGRYSNIVFSDTKKPGSSGDDSVSPDD